MSKPAKAEVLIAIREAVAKNPGNIGADDVSDALGYTVSDAIIAEALAAPIEPIVAAPIETTATPTVEASKETGPAPAIGEEESGKASEDSLSAAGIDPTAAKLQKVAEGVTALEQAKQNLALTRNAIIAEGTPALSQEAQRLEGVKAIQAQTTASLLARKTSNDAVTKILTSQGYVLPKTYASPLDAALAGGQAKRSQFLRDGKVVTAPPPRSPEGRQAMAQHFHQPKGRRELV